jgi:RNA polymerase sigma-B factor
MSALGRQSRRARIVSSSPATPTAVTLSIATASSTASCRWPAAWPLATCAATSPSTDILQVACIGLIKAIDGFDDGRGRAFSSYAVPTIVGEIERYYRDRTWAVHVARDLQDRVIAVARAADELESEHQRRPTVGEIAERLGVEREQVVEARAAALAHRPDSLDAPVRGADDEGLTVGDRMAVTEDGYRGAENRAALRWMMRVLSPRDRLIVRLRFERDLTQEQIGEHIGLSQMQVSRVLRQSIVRLREGANAEAA